MKLNVFIFWLGMLIIASSLIIVFMSKEKIEKTDCYDRFGSRIEGLTCESKSLDNETLIKEILVIGVCVVFISFIVLFLED